MIQTLKISKIKPNPNNPRIIKDDKFKKLVKSIKDFPEMLNLRPIVVNADMIVLGGNMRLKAAIEAKMTSVPIIIAKDLTADQQREFIIKDNLSGGEWDWDMLNLEWPADQLEEWGLDMPNFAETEELEEGEPETENQFFLNIRCENENECQKLYEKLISQGLDVKIVT